MSRLKNYASALASSYVALAANVAYTLASVPLALHYLSKPEFALWGLTIQIAGYVALIDLGMAGVSRILIDYKDRKDDPAYGSVIQTSTLVSVAQACLIVAFGVGLAFLLAPLLRVPTELEREFVWLVIGQCSVLAATFLTRIFTYLLAAHQRQDVLNYSQVGVFLVNFGVLWIGFQLGSGVFSILWSQLCGWVLASVVSAISCYKLRVFPPTASWGRPTWGRFWELFAFGRDMFLYSVGSQLVNASQTILITRTLGLDMAAIWSVCTRTYSLICLAVNRIFDHSCAGLAEMIVRNERERLLTRFKAIVTISTSLTVIAGIGFAVCNQPFVRWWTSGQIRWSPVNDWLLAGWLVPAVLVRNHTGLVGLTKDFRFLRYIYFLEGVFFVAVSFFVLRVGGVTAMIVVSILASLLFSFRYGIARTSRYFQVSWKEELVDWMRPPLRVFLLLLPVALGLCFFTSPLPPLWQFLTNGSIIGGYGAILFWRCGLDESTRNELRTRFLNRFTR